MGPPADDQLRDELREIARRWPPDLDDAALADAVAWLRQRVPVAALGLLWQGDEDATLRGYDLWADDPSHPMRRSFGFQVRWTSAAGLDGHLGEEGWRIWRRPGGQLGDRLLARGLHSVLLVRVPRGALVASFAEEPRDEHAPALLALAAAIGPSIERLLAHWKARQMQRFVLGTADVLLAFSGEGELTFASPSASSLWGAPTAELIGRSVESLLSLPGRLDALAGCPPVAGEVIAGEGRVPVEVTVGADRGQDPSAALRVRLRDVGRVGQMVADLARSAHDHRTILDTLPTLVFRCDDQARIFYVNAASEALLGYRPEEIVEHPEIAQAVCPGSALTVMGGKFAPFLASGGSVPWVDIDSRHRDGRPIILSTTLRPIGQPPSVTFLGIAQDVTELRRWQRQVVTADRLAALGTLAAGIGHEISNPSAYLSLGLEQALRALDRLGVPPESAALVERLRATLADAREGAARIEVMVAQLRQLARDPAAPEDGEIDLVQLLTSAASLANTRLRRHARLDLRLAPLPPMPAGFARLSQVVLNLLANAEQAIPAGRPEENHVLVEVRLEDERLSLRVSDTGCGIAPDVLPRVFDPFFTTKPVGEGTGLGLAISHDLVRQLGGEIVVDSRPGAGTTFTVRVPLHRRGA